MITHLDLCRFLNQKGWFNQHLEIPQERLSFGITLLLVVEANKKNGLTKTWDEGRGWTKDAKLS